MDDDRDIVNVMKRALELNNFQVFDFTNPLQAVEYFKSVDSPQLLVTDIRMPNMTGFELVREVKKDHPNLSIIVLTAFELSKSEFDKVFPSTKIDVVLKKPISPRKFIDAVNAIFVSKLEKKRCPVSGHYRRGGIKAHEIKLIVLQDRR